MATPLKNKNVDKRFLAFEKWFLHAREDQKIGPEPKFHAPRPSNGKD